jgi:hypothetical protein
LELNGQIVLFTDIHRHFVHKSKNNEQGGVKQRVGIDDKRSVVLDEQYRLDIVGAVIAYEIGKSHSVQHLYVRSWKKHSVFYCSLLFEQEYHNQQIE